MIRRRPPPASANPLPRRTIAAAERRLLLEATRLRVAKDPP